MGLMGAAVGCRGLGFVGLLVGGLGTVGAMGCRDLGFVGLLVGGVGTAGVGAGAGAWVR